MRGSIMREFEFGDRVVWTERFHNWTGEHRGQVIASNREDSLIVLDRPIQMTGWGPDEWGNLSCPATVPTVDIKKDPAPNHWTNRRPLSMEAVGDHMLLFGG